MANNDERLANILSKNNIIFGMNSWDKVGFFDTDIDLTNEPEDNFRMWVFYPDSVYRGDGDLFDATVAVSYPNNKDTIQAVVDELGTFAFNSFVYLALSDLLKGWDTNDRSRDIHIFRIAK